MAAFCTIPVSSINRLSTIAAAVRHATKLLRNANVPEPAASAEYLAIASFNEITSRSGARASKQTASSSELNHFSQLVQERATKRTPIQYLVGNWDFHNVTLKVRPPILIPRPETEELVEHVLADELLPEDARVLDIGCGSGALLLALLAARSGWRGVGVDISNEAIALSSENASLLAVSARTKFIQGDVAALSLAKVSPGSKLDVIVSNPPYIPSADMISLDPEVKLHEDTRALCGGEDGLDVVNQVLAMSCDLLKSGRHIWLEVDESHPPVLKEKKYQGLRFVASFKDIYGRNRFCKFVKE